MVTGARIAAFLAIVCATSAASCPSQQVGDAIALGVEKGLEKIPAGTHPVVTPLQIDPPELTFLGRPSGSTSRSVVIRNTLKERVVISAIEISGRFFRMKSPVLPATVEPDGQLTLEVEFEPLDSTCRCRGKLTVRLSHPTPTKQDILLSGSVRTRSER